MKGRKGTYTGVGIAVVAETRLSVGRGGLAVPMSAAAKWPRREHQFMHRDLLPHGGNK